MKSRITLLSIIILMLTSCYQETIPGRDNMLKNKTYVHLYFKTEKECLEAQPEPDFFYNCHQQVDFYENNVVEIMLSDIIWRGKYSVHNNNVILNFEPNSEIPDGEISFQMLPSNMLFNTKDQTLWKKVNGNSIWK